jgi:hypothetical protein
MCSGYRCYRTAMDGGLVHMSVFCVLCLTVCHVLQDSISYGFDWRITGTTEHLPLNYSVTCSCLDRWHESRGKSTVVAKRRQATALTHPELWLYSANISSGIGGLQIDGCSSGSNSFFILRHLHAFRTGVSGQQRSWRVKSFISLDLNLASCDDKFDPSSHLLHYFQMYYFPEFHSRTFRHSPLAASIFVFLDFLCSCSP